ncbi:unnamed protein product [Urochloa humidicola]
MSDKNFQQVPIQASNPQISNHHNNTNIQNPPSIQNSLTQTGAHTSQHNPNTLHIPTHDLFAGTRCYIDAAITPHLQRYFARQAGLGILIEGDQHQPYRKIFIQAITDGALDPLQAETYAMVLAAKIINTLQINRVHYFTDASILATNLQKQDPVTQAADWRNRALLAEFLSASQQSTYRVTKISRRKNVTAHALAAQARTQADTPACLFVCNNPTHTSSCVVQLNLQNILWGACRLISVSCF